MIDAAADDTTWRDHLVAMSWIAVMVSFLPASLTLTLWVATSRSAPPVLVALVGLSGLTLVVVGAGTAASTVLAGGEVVAAQRKLGLAKRTATSIERISLDLRVASGQTDWTPRVQAALRNSAEALDALVVDLSTATDAMTGAALRNGHSTRMRSLVGLALTWTGTLMQGAAIWWAVS